MELIMDAVTVTRQSRQLQDLLCLLQNILPEMKAWLPGSLRLQEFIFTAGIHLNIIIPPAAVDWY